jgi:molybdenum cofactor cytidylyltransferase
MSSFRSFAIVPAAGRSVRMGRPKLLLPWRDTTLIQHVLSTWISSQVERVVVVVRPDDSELATVCRRAGVDVVLPTTAPPEMKVSVQYGLRHVEQTCNPRAEDVWLLAPADIPGLLTSNIDWLLASHAAHNLEILVPKHDNRRGHPVLFPWPLAREVQKLAENDGVNALLHRHPVREVHCPHAGVQEDVDTPDDYRRLRRREVPP